MSYVDDAEIYVAKYGDDVSDILRTGAFFKSSTFEEVNKFINSIDARLVENEYFNNGVRVATRKQIRKYKKEMSSKGINVVVDKKGKILDYTNV